MSPATNDIRAVMFDLGGVVVEVNDMALVLKDAGVTDHRQFLDTWLHCPAVRAFESGRCDEAAFAEGVVRNQNLRIDPADFLAAFRAWPKGVYPGVKTLIAEVRERVTVGCLSNTNPIHWPDFADELDGGRMFDHPIISYEIGMMKPDREIFDYAAARVGVAPHRILFLDDHPQNTAAARAAGFNAECVVGPDESRAALIRHGVLGDRAA